MEPSWRTGVTGLYHDLRLSRPRTCTRYLLSMAKLDANMEAVSLRQSVQLQTKVLIRPGPSTGWWVG